uniref:Uncharacterized protein n=1 Tax=Oryza brachyantha TaxID=4533 RepID=J3LVL8_ORYBR
MTFVCRGSTESSSSPLSYRGGDRTREEHSSVSIIMLILWRDLALVHGTKQSVHNKLNTVKSSMIDSQQKTINSTINPVSEFIPKLAKIKRFIALCKNQASLHLKSAGVNFAKTVLVRN